MKISISQLYKRSEFSKIIQLFKSNRQEFQKNLEGLSYVANSLFKLKYYKECIEVLNTLVDQKYKLEHSLPMLSFCQCETGLTKIAIRTGFEALKYNLTSELAYISVGIAFLKEKRYPEALEAFKTTEKLNPKSFDAWANIGNCYIGMSNYQDGIQAYENALKLKPNRQVNIDNLMLSILYSDEHSKAFKENLRNKLIKKFPPKKITEKIYKKSSKIEGIKKTKIALISADFRGHSVFSFIKNLFLFIDRGKFEIYCYFNDFQEDEYTKFVKEKSDIFLNIYNLSDIECFKEIKKHEIDILFDLSGHTKGNRLSLFSYRPAEIMISWIGFAGPTANSNIDYWLVDNITNPEANLQKVRPQLLKMTDTFLNFSPKQHVEIPSEITFSSTRDFYFGSFNNFSKLSKSTLACWSEIINRTTNTHIVFKCKQLNQTSFRSRVKDILNDVGIPENRYSLAPQTSSLTHHMHYYSAVDLALDPFPYNGTTTTCECLYMGTPVLTLRGNDHVSRVGASLLSSVGLKEYIVESQELYVKRAMNLSNSGIRQSKEEIRQSLLNSSLGNGQKFYQDFEKIILNVQNANLTKNCT